MSLQSLPLGTSGCRRGCSERQRRCRAVSHWIDRHPSLEGEEGGAREGGRGEGGREERKDKKIEMGGSRKGVWVKGRPLG